MSNIDLSFIVVFLNEDWNIEATCNEIAKISSIIPEISYEIVLVNDGSTDNSWQVAKRLASENDNIKAIDFVRNFGAISAVIAGMTHSSGKYLVDMNADGQENVDLFANLYLENINNNLEISWAVRRSRNDPFFSKMFSYCYSKIMQKFAIENFPSEGLDAFCISRKLAQYVLDNYTSTSNLHNLLFWAGNKSGRVEYDRFERKQGKSKWSFKKKMNLFINSFVSFSYFPLRLVTIVGIILAFVGFVWGMYIVIYNTINGFPIQGWASLIAVLLFGFGITNLSLGIISEYIWRIMENVNPKPLYIIREVVKKEQ